MTPKERAKEYASKAIESIVKELEETTGNKYEPTDGAISEIEQHYLAGYHQAIEDNKEQLLQSKVK